MMKKIMATMLCLTIATPCFAFGRHHKHYPTPLRRPHYTYVVYDNHNDIHVHKPHRTSQRTKTLAAVTGIAGVAAIISAMID